MFFFLIFIIIPLTELAVFAAVSEHIGIVTTLLLAFLTALIGGTIVRHQGLSVIFRMRESMQRGGMPLNELFDGACLIAAGAMLITPGFVTDTAGGLLLIPAFRQLLRTAIKNHTTWHVQSNGPIEGEYERIDDE